MGTNNSFIYGVGSGIGSGNPTRLTNVGFDSRRGVLIKASSTNTSVVYLGGADVENSLTGSNTTTGFELAPAESVVLPVMRVNGLYAVANSGSQKVSFFAS